MQAMELLLSDSRGVYIPRDFVNEFDLTKFEGINPDDVTTIKSGPDHEWYWESWEMILQNSEYREDGYTWRLHQDGDLWLVCAEKLTNEEYSNFFGEMKPAPEHSYEFAVCGDCLIAEANGDYSGMGDGLAKTVEASLDRLHEEYQQVIADGAEYGFLHSNCECCGALAGNRFRLIAFKDPYCIGVEP